jgi:hypothetical protein
MNNLIKYILTEQTREDEYDILSRELIGLAHKKIKRYPLSFFMVDQDNVINLELDKNGFLWVNNGLLKHLSRNLFSNPEETKRVLKKWIIKNYK